MPLITVSTRQGKSQQFIDTVLNAVHTALVASGVPEGDRFHRVFELEAAHFKYDPNYPDLTSPRSDNYVLIEITLSVGRSVKIKKQIVQQTVSSIQQNLHINPDDIMVVFIETRWENWSFAGGRFIHV